MSIGHTASGGHLKVQGTSMGTHMKLKTLCKLLFLLGNFGLSWTVDIDNIARDLAITYDVVRHNPPSPVYGNSFLANVTLINIGNETIPATGWSIFFCHKPLIQPLYYNTTDGQYFGGGLILSGNITLTHVKGCLFEFKPYDGNNTEYTSLPLFPGETRNVSFLSSNTAVSRYDIFPYWYVANETHQSVIKNTEMDDPFFVTMHNTFLKWMRSVPTDLFGTPPGLWNRWRATNFTEEETARYEVIPTPNSQQMGNGGNVTVDNTWTIDRDRDGRLIEVAKFLQDSIPGIEVTNKMRKSPKVIQLYIRRNRPATESPERYRIAVRTDPDRIEIGGNTVAGVFNGIQTLFSLLAFDGTIQEMTILDEPRFKYRGLMLDVASNFVSKTTILKLLNVMSLYKLNKLQLNLANNFGWRIEIPDIPELTQIGGRRCHDLTERTCLLNQLGSNPVNSTAQYYTAQDYVEILQAARIRNIEIIPGIHMAGKSRAAIVAMKEYERRTGDLSMRIHDPNDTAKYLTEELFSDASVNPCLLTAENFLNKTLKSLIQYHARAKSPLRIINLGGYDTPLTAKLNSTHCIALNFTGVDPTMLIKVNYTTRLANVAGEYNVHVSGIEEFFMAWPTTDTRGGILVPFSRKRFPSNIEIHPVVRNSNDPLTFQRAQVFANVGYKVILSPSDYFSLDHAPEANPEIPGDYWAIRHIPAERVFNYLPDNRCCNLNPDEFLYGKFTANGCIDTEDCIQVEKPENIMGIQAQMWTMKVRNEDQLFELLFPRLLAYAERAWHKAPWEKTYVGQFNRSTPYVEPDLKAQVDDWARFASVVGHKELRRLEAYGIAHRVPPPGVHIDPLYVDPFDGRNKTVLLTDVQYPGLVPQVYGANNQWADLGPITDITNITVPLLTFRSRNPTGTRSSIMETMNLQVPNAYMAQLLAAGVLSGLIPRQTSFSSSAINTSLLPVGASSANSVPVQASGPTPDIDVNATLPVTS